MKVTGEIFGDWDRLEETLKALAKNNSAYKMVIRDIADKITEAIWDLIESQSIELEPLVAEYKARKVAEGHDERILIRTGDFLNSIDVTDIQIKGQDINVLISVRDGTTETGLSMKELASFLEYGTENMPARKPFERSWEEIRKDVKEEVSERLKSEILEDFK